VFLARLKDVSNVWNQKQISVTLAKLIELNIMENVLKSAQLKCINQEMNVKIVLQIAKSVKIAILVPFVSLDLLILIKPVYKVVQLVGLKINQWLVLNVTRMTVIAVILIILNFVSNVEMGLLNMKTAVKELVPMVHIEKMIFVSNVRIHVKSVKMQILVLNVSQDSRN
jgi:hypothetical protein